MRKGHRTITVKRHQEGKQSKVTISFFPIKMIVKLERTQSTTQQNMEQTQNRTIGAKVNSKSTTTEPLPLNGQQPELRATGRGVGLKCI